MPQPRILLLAGSTSAASASSRLAAAFSRELAFLDAEPTRISLADHPLPLYDPDERTVPPPNPVARLRALVRDHHAAFIATPEVAGSVPALLKNLLDWLADDVDPRSHPASGRLFAVASVSADGSGGRTALAHLRSVLSDGFGATLIGAGLAIGEADDAFDDKGRLIDPQQAAAVTRLARELVHATRRLAPLV